VETLRRSTGGTTAAAAVAAADDDDEDEDDGVAMPSRTVRQSSTAYLLYRRLMGGLKPRPRSGRGRESGTGDFVIFLHMPSEKTVKNDIHAKRWFASPNLTSSRFSTVRDVAHP